MPGKRPSTCQQRTGRPGSWQRSTVVLTSTALDRRLAPSLLLTEQLAAALSGCSREGAVLRKATSRDHLALPDCQGYAVQCLCMVSCQAGPSCLPQFKDVHCPSSLLGQSTACLVHWGDGGQFTRAQLAKRSPDQLFDQPGCTKCSKRTSWPPVTRLCALLHRPKPPANYLAQLAQELPFAWRHGKKGSKEEQGQLFITRQARLCALG